jgi:ketosteroid isomerase-like protein
MKHFFVKFLGIVVPIAIVTILFSACNNQPAKTEGPGFSFDSVKAAIAASNKVFGASFATGDSVAFANCYTSDACINVTGLPRMCGTQAINGFFNMAYKMGTRGITITTEEVMGGKDAVVEIGKYELFAANNFSVEKGKFIVIWKEENGKWKMHRDIWNSDAPPPTPEPAPAPAK